MHISACIDDLIMRLRRLVVFGIEVTQTVLHILPAILVS